MAKIEWNKVTWYSKLIVVVLFLIVFTVGFYLGRQWLFSTPYYLKGESIDWENKCDYIGSLPEHSQCSFKQWKVLDEQEKAVFKKVYDKAKTEDKDKLKTSEYYWTFFGDSSCPVASNGTIKNMKGDDYEILTYDCYSFITVQRIHQLQSGIFPTQVMVKTN